MRYVEALEEYNPQPGERSVFLAGGINGAPDWQQKYREYFADTDIILVNPRRKAPKWDEPEGQRQVSWEFEHLRKVTTISFWFPAEAVCATSLLELGSAAVRVSNPVFVGVHPLYWKRQGVAYQLKLARPEVRVVSTLEDLANQVRKHFGYDHMDASAVIPVPNCS